MNKLPDDIQKMIDEKIKKDVGTHQVGLERKNISKHNFNRGATWMYKVIAESFKEVENG